MPIRPGQHILIPGAGLVGSLAGLWLARKGFKATLIDKRKQPVKGSLIEARSINLALSHRGWKALRAVGIEEEIKQIAVPMAGRVLHDAKGNTQFQPYGREGQAIYSVSRAALNQALNDRAEAEENLEILYDTRARSVDFETSTLTLLHQGQEQKLKGDVVLACDGAFSAIRQVFQVSDRFDFSQEYIAHGYQEFHLQAVDGKWAMEPGGLHIWPRKSFMMIALPNPDQTFTCTLFLAWEGHEDSFEALKDGAYAARFFGENFPDFCRLVPDYEEQAQRNPISSLVTMRCYPWHRVRTLLVGDAAHAIVPFYGQGMNAGFEDVDILMNMLPEYDTWESLFTAFSAHRKPDAEAIADMALLNFTEMRDKVSQPEFQWQKKIDARLAGFYPESWVPMYTMVSFTSTPYLDALDRGMHQEKVLRRIMAYPDARLRWEDERWLKLAYSSAVGGD